MPELPEVEVLARHLAPQLQNKVIQAVEVRRERVLRPTPLRQFRSRLKHARFLSLSRRGKYLLFTLSAPPSGDEAFLLVGHLGMTGRIYLAPVQAPLPRHAAVVLNLGKENFVFEDTRYFGKLTLDRAGVDRLGPEPLEAEFTVESFGLGLQRSSQPVKIKLLDQTLVAGIGNIYASEALFRARISPLAPARGLKTRQVEALWLAIREVLLEAIEFGSTVPLDYSGMRERDGLFYFGRSAETPDSYEERLQVYGREGEPCPDCGKAIKRVVQAARSTFYCPRCQQPSRNRSR